MRLIFIDHGNMFRGFRANLRGAWLNGIDLSKGQLEEAVLTGARLNGGNLRETCLRGAYLTNTELKGADMRETDMQGADLVSAKMQGTDLKNADMQGVYLGGACLQGAIFEGTCMKGATNLTISEEFEARKRNRICKPTALADGLEENDCGEVTSKEGFSEVVFLGKLQIIDIHAIVRWIKSDDLKNKMKVDLENDLEYERLVKEDNESINRFLEGKGARIRRQ